MTYIQKCETRTGTQYRIVRCKLGFYGIGKILFTFKV